MVASSVPEASLETGREAPPAAMKAWQFSKFGGGADALQVVLATSLAMMALFLAHNRSDANGSFNGPSLSPCHDVLQLHADVPVPKPKPGEILIRVQAASVNPVDWKLQSGILRPFLPRKMPWTPGMDAAGEVVEVGVDAGSYKKGDQVFGMVNVMAQPAGTFAQYVVLPVSSVARRPPSVSPAEAACLPVCGLTALQSLRDFGKLAMGPKVDGFADSAKEHSQRAPANVLVANASGGVGHYAVQIAKLAGDYVTATCGQRNIDFVKKLGADEALDYKTPEGAALQSPSGRKYDVVVDGTVALSQKVVWPELAPTGKWLHLTPHLSTMASALWNAATFSKKKLYPVVISPNANDLTTLARLAGEGKLKTTLEAKVPFDDAPEAWRKSMEGHVTGKIVVVAEESK